jgi:hypothetical protein
MLAGAAGSGGGWCGAGQASGDGGGVERLVDRVGLGEAGQAQALGGLWVELSDAALARAATVRRQPQP